MANAAVTGWPRRPHAFLKLHPEELHVLSALDGWMLRLFAALVMLAEFRSGNGRTHYWMLVNACSPIQPARGGPRHFVPSEWSIRDAMLRFERARILKRYESESEWGGEIFYRVASRQGNFALR